MEIKIMMIGGRRCGKTSVLAVMQKCFESKFGNTNLSIEIEDTETLFTLDDKLKEMDHYFTYNKAKRFTADENETVEITSYEFNISLKSKPNGKIKFIFSDYPGEWIEGKIKDKVEELKNMIEQSDVVIVAVDTPYLMENIYGSKIVGEYNEDKNQCNIITQLLKNKFKKEMNSKQKMILFVPLKCEKYLKNGEMGLVNEKIKYAYKALINEFSSDYNTKYEMAITPIFTLGTIEFARFQREEGSDIFELRGKKYPNSLYRFTNNEASEPSSKYCEQPLVYILRYIIKLAEFQKLQRFKKGSMLLKIAIRLSEVFFKMPSAEDFMREEDNLKKMMVTKGDGYEIVCNPLKF